MDVWTIVGVVFCVACIIGTFVYYGCINIEPQEKPVDKTKSPTITLPCNVGDVVWFDTYKKNAKRIAEGFKNSSGAKGAADKIIQVCNDIKL